jgi:hypothetical protein
MDIFQPQPDSSYSPQDAAASIPIRLLRIANLLSPEQRLLLSAILFMDVCVLCFAALFLFQKIALPF